MGPGQIQDTKPFLALPMATQIICPACGTRYETKAVFPPEGRKVRCSRCAHVWQAKPVAAAPAPPAMPQPPAQPQPQPAAVPKPAAPQQAPAPQMTPPPQPVPPSANAAMRGFAGIQSTPTPPPLTKEAVEADLAAQVARINAEAMAEAPPAAPPEGVSPGAGIFARLAW